MFLSHMGVAPTSRLAQARAMGASGGGRGGGDTPQIQPLQTCPSGTDA